MPVQWKVFKTTTFDPDKFVRFNFFNPCVAVINQTAGQVVKDLRKATSSSFDNPTPFTKRAFAATSASPDQETPSSTVYIQPDQSKYLWLEVYGGPRKVGDYGTSKKGLVIGKANLNIYGNLPRGYISRMVKRKKAFSTPSKKDPANTLVWLRDGKDHKKLIAVINKEGEYKPRLHFFDVVAKSVEVNIPKAIRAVFKRAKSRL